MGKKTKKLSRVRAGKRTSSPSNPKGEILYQGRVVFSISTDSVAVGAVTLQSLLSTTDLILARLSDNFQLYRYERLAVALMPGETAALAYVNALADNPPATYLAVANLPNSCFTVGSQTVPSRFVVSPKFLLGESPNMYWKTQLSTVTPTWDEVQGVFYIGFTSATSATALISVNYVVRLSDAVNSAMTPSPSITDMSLEARHRYPSGSDAIITSPLGVFRGGRKATAKTSNATRRHGANLEIHAAEGSGSLQSTTVNVACKCCPPSGGGGI